VRGVGVCGGCVGGVEVRLEAGRGVSGRGNVQSWRPVGAASKQHESPDHTPSTPIYSPHTHLPRGALGADQSDMGRLGGLMQCDVLPDEHADADAGQVEAVEKLVDLGHLCRVFCMCVCVGGVR